MPLKHRAGNYCRIYRWGGSAMHAADAVSFGTDAGSVRHVPPRREATATRRPTVIARTMHTSNGWRQDSINYAAGARRAPCRRAARRDNRRVRSERTTTGSTPANKTRDATDVERVAITLGRQRSLIAMVITTYHNYVLSNGMEVVGGTFLLVFTAVIFLIAVALFPYASKMKKRGVLT